MSSSFVFSSWVPTTIPTSTVLSSINPTHSVGLISTLTSATADMATATKLASLMHISQDIRGAQASLDIIMAQQVLATATVASVQSQATQAIFNATLNLKALEWDENAYGTDLSMAANVIFTVLFGIVFLVQTGLLTWLRFFYFGGCLFCGAGLEFAGYLTRSLAVNDTSDSDYFLCQIITLTIAPAFIMAGIYYLLAKLIVVHGHGRTFSMLKPIWYSYIFVICDVLSLVIQAIGGGMAAVAVIDFEDTDSGTHVMVAGIAFQVVSMTLFLFFWFDFLHRIYFKVNPNVSFTFHNVIALVNNGKRADDIRAQCEPYFDQNHAHLRHGKFFKWFPHVVTGSVLFIYIRCIYRVVELAQGWTGYLITHEVYVMTLDAMMVFFTCALLSIIHPVLFLGRDENLKLRISKKDIEADKSPDYEEGRSNEKENPFQ